jgi:hypothetical protein
MAVDQYQNEPVVQIPPDLWRQYEEARESEAGWVRRVTFLRDQIEKLVGEAHAGMVGTKKVVTYRPISTYSVRGIQRDYPEMAQNFEREETRTVFDLDAFRAQHEEIAEQYRSRQFRVVE